ncbi:MAG: T9SS type A sorting domain-containing protein [Bacteroidia bacterium]
MKHIILILSIFYFQNGIGQNLILNYSFEDTIPKVINPNLGGPEGAPPWFTPTCGSSPDYLSETYYYGITPNVPMNDFGYQFAKTGVAYCGFVTFVPSNPGHREKISYKLASPLIQNHNYYFGFYVSCGDSEKYATDKMGGYFSVDTPDFCLGFIFTPQINNPPGNILSDTANWVLVSGQFIAQGGERVISIGNFFPDSQTQYVIINPNAPPNYSFAYYYIDDVSLIDCTAVGIKENEPLAFSFSPNPCNGYLLLSTIAQLKTYNVYNTLGEEILSGRFSENVNYKIDVVTLPKGLYFLVVEDKNKIRGIRKFIKQ